MLILFQLFRYCAYKYVTIIDFSSTNGLGTYGKKNSKMRSFKVSVDAGKAEFFIELLDNLGFVSYEEDPSIRIKKNQKRLSADTDKRNTTGSSRRKTKPEDDFDSLEHRKKSLEDIRKAMINIDKLRNSK